MRGLGREAAHGVRPRDVPSLQRRKTVVSADPGPAWADTLPSASVVHIVATALQSRSVPHALTSAKVMPGSTTATCAPSRARSSAQTVDPDLPTLPSLVSMDDTIVTGWCSSSTAPSTTM